MLAWPSCMPMVPWRRLHRQVISCRALRSLRTVLAPVVVGQPLSAVAAAADPVQLASLCGEDKKPPALGVQTAVECVLLWTTDPLLPASLLCL